MARRRKKLRCKKKPLTRITGYTRCPPNTAGRRKTTEQRRAKRCTRPVRKERVGGHRRRVCHT